MAIYHTDEDPNDVMWQEQQDAIELKKITDDMECNGYAHFNLKEFEAKSNKPCYVPENAESLEDVFSYQTLKKIVKEWLKEDNTIEALLDKGNTEKDLEDVDNFTHNLYHSLEWQFPSTLLEEWAY